MKERKDRRDISGVISMIQQAEHGMTTAECAQVMCVSRQRARDLLARHKYKVIQHGNNHAARWYAADYFNQWENFKLSKKPTRDIESAYQLLQTIPNGAHISLVANVLKVSNDRAGDLMRRDDRFILLGSGLCARWCVESTHQTALEYQRKRKEEVRKRKNASSRSARSAGVKWKKKETAPQDTPTQWPRPVNSVWELAAA